jgi:hypothetical protein
VIAFAKRVGLLVTPVNPSSSTNLRNPPPMIKLRLM